MARISAIMDIGKRSMQNSQTALQTVSHNIANKSTEGYSRQRVENVTAQPIGEGNLQIGMGSRASQVTRTNNPFLEKQLQKEQGQMGFLESRADGMSRVEQVFNEQANKGINQYVTDFFNGFRELSNNPESVTSRTVVKEAAMALTTDFKRANDQLSKIQNDLDEQTVSQVNEVNSFTKEIANLNKDIKQIEVQGIPANDQRDRRDLLIKKLNEKIDISYAEGKDGMMTVSAAGNAILVSGLESHQLETYREGDGNKAEVYYRENPTVPSFKITDRIKGGSMGGAIDVRDKVITDIRGKLDTMAFSLAEEVNKAHMEGFDRSGKPGQAFFEIADGAEGASANLKLNKEIETDVSKIAASARKGAVGDNTVANVISVMQFKPVMNEGQSTFDDFYNSEIGRVGVLSQRATQAKDAQVNNLQQLSTLRESISGVSLDEEATHMIEFQKTFDASAKLIKVADEMFDTVLSLKR